MNMRQETKVQVMVWLRKEIHDWILNDLFVNDFGHVIKVILQLTLNLSWLRVSNAARAHEALWDAIPALHVEGEKYTALQGLKEFIFYPELSFGSML